MGICALFPLQAAVFLRDIRTDLHEFFTMCIMFQCIMFHLFESENHVSGNDILTSDVKGAWCYKGRELLVYVCGLCDRL